MDPHQISLFLDRAAMIVRRKTSGSQLCDEYAESLIPRFKENEIIANRVLGRGEFCTVREVQEINLHNEYSPQQESEFQKPILDSFIHERCDRCEEKQAEPEIRCPPTKNSSCLRLDREFIAENTKNKSFTSDLLSRKDSSSVSSKTTSKMSETEGGRLTSRCRYAIKTINPILPEKENDDRAKDKFFQGLVDMITEARYLSTFKHTHIIKMHAVSSLGNTPSKNFFIILDRLTDTLNTRVTTWKKKRRKYSRIFQSRFTSERFELLYERLSVASDICSALKYLHEKRIMHRDLKPDNIGFDIHDTVKIFDFGFSKELPADSVENEVYTHSGQIGSLRYMAPEVVLEKEYNLSVDVYSFSILLYQIMALKKPFNDLSTTEQHIDLVVKGGKRPKLKKKKWPKGVSDLIEQCWSDNIFIRPQSKEVHNKLSQILFCLGGGEGGALDISDHSTVPSINSQQSSKC